MPIQLTSHQKKAIELMPDQNVQLIACAGSGKTEIVSRGIARILEKGAKPSSIVAFTFTEKAAEALKNRIRTVLHQSGQDDINIGDMYVGTIHSYCFEMLKDLVPEYRGFDVLDDASRVAFVSKPKNYYERLKLVKLENAKGLKRFSVISRFIDSIDIFLDEGIDYGAVAETDSELAYCINAYREALQKDRYLDFSTMIHEFVTLLENKDKILVDLHDRLRFLVVDEYQDVNALQERLIRAMIGPDTKITVVGDDDQSIYGWRGAVVENIIDFKNRFNDVKQVKLEANFRSSQPIIELATKYIKLNSHRLSKKMGSPDNNKQKNNPDAIQYRHFETEEDQTNFIVAHIRELTGSDFIGKDGVPYALSPGDMAILVRSNSDVRRLLPLLDNAGIDYVVDSGETVFDQEIVKIAREFLNYIFDLSAPSLSKLVDWYRKFLEREGYKKISQVAVNELVSELRNRLDKIKQKGTRDYLPDLGLQGIFHELLHAMGIHLIDLSESDHYYLATLSQSISDYEKVWQRLRHSEYKYFSGFIQAWGQRSYTVTSTGDSMVIDAVKVMTIHKAKGLEFPVVFIPYLNQKQKRNMPLSFISESLFDARRYRGNDEDERRVYYVALTRSEKYLFMSGMKKDTTKKPRVPAAVINELPSRYIHKPVQLKLAKTGLRERRQMLYDMSTNFSDLSAYGRCAYDYKLRHVFGYNAGVPVAFGYGTQIHNILNILHKEYEGIEYDPDMIDELVRKHFYLRYAPGAINEHMREAASKVVKNYVRNHSNDFGNVLETEKSFELMLEDTLINGQIDLIKKLDSNGKVQEVEVVDFKSDHSLLYKEDYQHQLRLYVMACKRALDMNPQKACIHDLETGEKNYVSIDPDSMKKTENELKVRIDGIRKETFRPVNDARICTECDYAKICRHCKIAA